MTRPGFFNTMTISYNGELVDPGRCIRRMRTNLQLSQAELANKAGICQGYLSALELNRHPASTKVYNKIAEAMGISVGQMFGH